jgi:YD repeat-containing protein
MTDQRVKRTFSTAWGVILLALCLAWPVSAAADQAQYIYDGLGRLIRVIDSQGNVATYHYDAVGNLEAITRDTTAGLQLTAGPISPNFGRQDTEVDVSIPGANLFASTLTTDNAGVIVSQSVATDTSINAHLVIAQNATIGTTNVRIDNGVSSVTLPFTIGPAPSLPVIAPLVILVTPNGGTATATISMATNDGYPTALTLTTGDSQIATVNPTQLTLQPGESQPVTITGGTAGGTALSVTISQTVNANIFVDQPYSGQTFEASTGVSVVITATPTQPTQNVSPMLSPLISVQIDAGPPFPPTQTVSPILSPVISVLIESTTPPSSQTLTPFLAPLMSVQNP